ncbi:MAG: hypothetical protein Q8P56_03235 [Candidatus Uhrbacteria bacterium]|nr:hypothetical protein [Candidatus Uhrbacteria bacterium]
MLTLFLEWGEGLAKLSLKVYNRIRRLIRPHKDETFVVRIDHAPFIVAGNKTGASRFEELEVSARSKRGARTKALAAIGSRSYLSGPLLKRGKSEIISVEVKEHNK